jgi:hypothetical protein
VQFASFVTVDPRSLRFPAGRLVVGGVYTIRVRGEMERNADLANVVDYMVRVVSAGLSASISGAQVRRMSRFVEFDLDASESQDLDGLDGVPMAFSWTCARALPDELVPVYDEPCSPLAWDVTDVIGTDAVLLVPAEMPVGAYRFAVTVTKGEDGLKLPFALRSSTDYVVVTLVDARIPTVTVSALADVVFVGGTAVVNTGSKPILEAAVSPGKACCGARRSCRCCRNERCGVSFNRVLAVSGFEVEGSWSVDNVEPTACRAGRGQPAHGLDVCVPIHGDAGRHRHLQLGLHSALGECTAVGRRRHCVSKERCVLVLVWRVHIEREP